MTTKYKRSKEIQEDYNEIDSYITAAEGVNVIAEYLQDFVGIYTDVAILRSVGSGKIYGLNLTAALKGKFDKLSYGDVIEIECHGKRRSKSNPDNAYWDWSVYLMEKPEQDNDNKDDLPF